LAYIGNIPAESYASFETETFSVSATTNYTLSHAVTNENEIRLVINGVVQQPGSGKAYTASGTTLTLTSATVSGDSMYAVYLGRALQTVNPPAASVGNSQTAPTIITGQTAETSIATDDTILIHDTSASALRKMTRANFVSGVGGVNTPFCYGQKASAAVISRATMTKVTGMTEFEIDTASAFDGTTFTVPSGQGGKYQIIAALTGDYSDVGQDGEETAVAIRINNSEKKLATIRTSSASGQNMRVVTTVANMIATLSATDYVEMFAHIQDASGSNAKIAAGLTSLTIFKLIE